MPPALTYLLQNCAKVERLKGGQSCYLLGYLTRLLALIDVHSFIRVSPQ